MKYKNIIPFALAPADTGYRNQILGAFHALAELTGNIWNDEDLFILPDNSTSFQDVRNALYASKFKSYNEFKKQVFILLDKYFEKQSFVPRIFITTYNATESNKAGENADMLCHAIKAYYIAHKLGRVMTVVLTSKYYKYRYVDLINIPKHLMTFSLRIRLIQNQSLRKKVLTTIGIIHSFNRDKIDNQYKILEELLSQFKDDEELKDIVKKFETYKRKSKKAVFCLGGRVEGSEIIFDINYIQKLYSDAEKLVRNGYGVIFVNGPRTPNNVADYLYEKTKTNPNIIFQNCKRLAQTAEDRVPSQWRIYSGPNEENFKKMQKLGNVYPAVLAFDNTIVVHTMDSYASCETANVAIPTAISGKGLFIDPIIRYDCLNLALLLCPKYALDFDEFMNMACNMKIEPKDLHPRVLSSPLRVFAETAIKRLKQIEKTRNSSESRD